MILYFLTCERDLEGVYYFSRRGVTVHTKGGPAGSARLIVFVIVAADGGDSIMVVTVVAIARAATHCEPSRRRRVMATATAMTCWVSCGSARTEVLRQRLGLRCCVNGSD
ncbi:unnamed protein product [Prunus armeniaca]